MDGGKSRIILNALVTPFEVTENAPMLDLLWRTSFRWNIRPKQVTGDTAYGTTENIAAVEMADIRAYVPLTGAGKARPYFSKEEFAYDPERDIYRCPVGEILAPKTFRAEHKEVGSTSGSEAAQAGAGGGLASTGSDKSLQISCDWTVAFYC